MRMSPNLTIDRTSSIAIVRCAECRHKFGPAHEPWKPIARLRERPLHEIGRVHAAGPKVCLREFLCPSCGALLDTETAADGDPFLNDVIYVSGGSATR